MTPLQMLIAHRPQKSNRKDQERRIGPGVIDGVCDWVLCDDTSHMVEASGFSHAFGLQSTGGPPLTIITHNIHPST